MTMTRTKAWIAAIGSVVTAIGSALADNVFDSNDVATILTATVSAALTWYAVYKVPNRPVETAGR
jgi:hypothetical protein